MEENVFKNKLNYSREILENTVNDPEQLKEKMKIYKKIDQKKAEELEKQKLKKQKKEMREKIKFYRKILEINQKLENKYNYPPESVNYQKVILINTKTQQLTAYENGKKIYSFLTSTGNNNYPTPLGRFKVVAKHPMMWSNMAEKWMPYWIDFYQNGKYGIHAFPLDVYKNELYDESFLGVRLGGGCVRLIREEAEKIYNWVNLETKIFIF